MIRFIDRVAVVAVLAPLLLGAAPGDTEPAAAASSSWGEFLDPGRDCKVTHDPAKDHLTIAVPGTPHLMSAEIPGLPLDAPRVVREVYGDFRASVRVGGRLAPGSTGSGEFDPYHGAGLLIWQDAGNYLRLERAVGTIRGRETPYLNYELREDGRLTVTKGYPIKDQPMHLKLERVGKSIRAWRSADGSHWTELPGLATAWPYRVRVGVIAINSSRRPLQAELDRFRVDADMGAGPTATAANPPAVPAVTPEPPVPPAPTPPVPAEAPSAPPASPTAPPIPEPAKSTGERPEVR